METKTLIEMAMLKCAVAYNPKDINAWADGKTYSQMAQEMAQHLHSNGMSIQKYVPYKELVESETELTTNDGE